MSYRQQVQVVVAQYGVHIFAQLINPAQGPQGIRAPVDQVACQEQPVAIRIEADTLKQTVERLQATLKITDGVIAHRAPPA